MAFRRRRVKDPDAPARIYRNQIPGCLCHHCGKVITGSKGNPGEEKTWERVSGQSRNYHMQCAKDAGILTYREGQWFRVTDYSKVPVTPTDEPMVDVNDFTRINPNPSPVDVDEPEVTPVPFDEHFSPEVPPVDHPVHPPRRPEPPVIEKPKVELPDWMKSLGDYIDQRIRETVPQYIPEPKPVIDEKVIERIVEREILKINKPHITRVEVIDNRVAPPQVKDLGHQHPMFKRLWEAVQGRTYSGKRNLCLLVGPTGSGKTTAAERIAEGLQVEYFHFPAMDSKYDTQGFLDAQGRIVSTEFFRFWTSKGLGLCDELDSWFPTASLSLNSIANGYLVFAGHGKVNRHPENYLLGAANTWGLGGDNDYCGRYKLDAAFLNRWNVQFDWDYDEGFERSIFGNHPWVTRVQELRRRARAKGIKVIISPRESDTGPGLLDAGWSMEEVEAVTIRRSMKRSDWDSICLPR